MADTVGVRQGKLNANTSARQYQGCHAPRQYSSVLVTLCRNSPCVPFRQSVRHLRRRESLPGLRRLVGPLGFHPVDETEGCSLVGRHEMIAAGRGFDPVVVLTRLVDLDLLW